MKKQHLLSYLLLWIAVSIFTACQKEKQEALIPQEELLSTTETVMVPDTDGFAQRLQHPHNNNCNTFYGPAVKMGCGHVRSWINIRKTDHKPLALGIEMTQGSLHNLPTDAHDFAASTFVLPLHPKAKALTPFDHITINWEPEGHEPPGIYDVPHFDMHFYKISIADQLNISPLPTAAPPSGYLPASYVIEGATVPQMGTHWLDPASPELPPTLSPFTHTFIYGSHDGQVIFLEPMITRAFIMGGASVAKAIPQPTLFSPAGTHYPTVYKIWKNAGNSRHYVSLTNFANR